MTLKSPHPSGDYKDSVGYLIIEHSVVSWNTFDRKGKNGLQKARRGEHPVNDSIRRFTCAQSFPWSVFHNFQHLPRVSPSQWYPTRSEHAVPKSLRLQELRRWTMLNWFCIHSAHSVLDITIHSFSIQSTSKKAFFNRRSTLLHLDMMSFIQWKLYWIGRTSLFRQ